MIENQRDNFDLPRELVYLNAAYMTPFTNRMAEIAHSTSLDPMQHPWTLTADSFFETCERTRKKLGTLLGVDGETMAFAPSASYGAATAARNMAVAKGQVILLLEGQFPSNVYEWDVLAKEKNASLHFVKTPTNDDWTAAILTDIVHLEGRIAFAALPNVHWSSGAKIDLLQVSKALRSNGSGLVLDLTQSLGAMPTNLVAIDPDFAFSAGYKWMFGPYSTGFIYVAPRHLEGRSLEQNWISRKDSDDFARLVDYRDAYQAGARRFDVGERSNFMLLPLVEEAINQLDTWGIENIAETCGKLTDSLADIFQNAGFSSIVKEKRCQHILGVKVGAEQGAKLLNTLKNHNILVSLRGNMLRISPHVWVDEQDLAHVEKTLQTASGIKA